MQTTEPVKSIRITDDQIYVGGTAHYEPRFKDHRIEGWKFDANGDVVQPGTWFWFDWDAARKSRWERHEATRLRLQKFRIVGFGRLWGRKYWLPLPGFTTFLRDIVELDADGQDPIRLSNDALRSSLGYPTLSPIYGGWNYDAAPLNAALDRVASVFGVRYARYLSDMIQEYGSCIRDNPDDQD